MEHIITEQTFDKIDFSPPRRVVKGEYEYCAFNNCDFSTTDLSGIKFLECTFSGCNLSNATLATTALRAIKFTGCKMLGLRFDKCDKFGLDIHIDNCTLNYSSFYQAKLRKTIFRNATLREVDFTECDLTGSVFDNCDLARARFENTIIEKTDFRTAYNYSIDPELNKIKKARFSHSGIAGLLDKYDIEID
jgi:fluoroquinolone resistance protein